MELCEMDVIDHPWHVAINEHSNNLIKKEEEWPTWMYGAKSAALEIPRLALLFSQEREGKLAKTFKKCSCRHHEKHVADNHLTCCLGVECRKCPHLQALDKAKLKPEQIDWIKAWTCAGHIQSKGGDIAGEGFILTEHDKMFWSSVHQSMSEDYADDEEESPSPYDSEDG